jgi:RNA polymerase sigma factor (sigma-70 family)
MLPRAGSGGQVPPQAVDWKAVVEQIQAGNPAGQAILYDTLGAGARLFLKRRLPDSEDVEDRVHDVFVIVIDTIRRGELREPERLMGFVSTVLYRQLNAEIGRIVRTRKTDTDLDDGVVLRASDPSPEQTAITHQNIGLMRQLLSKLGARDLEILTRFYLREQPEDQIRKEMALTATQFTLVKSRAKARFSTLVHRRLARRIFISK